MKRKFVPEAALLRLLNERLQELLKVHTGGLFGPEDCEFKGAVVRLVPSEGGGNWSPPQLTGRGTASETCQRLATRAAQDVAAVYDLEVLIRNRDDWW